jgi:hypothetical protein
MAVSVIGRELADQFFGELASLRKGHERLMEPVEVLQDRAARIQARRISKADIFRSVAGLDPGFPVRA